MKVEFTIENARTLFSAASSQASISYTHPLGEAMVALARAIEEAEQRLAKDGPDAERRGHPPRPDWGWVTSGPIPDAVATLIQDNPGFQSIVDELAAVIRDSYDQLGLSLYDEATVYASLVLNRLVCDVATRRVVEGQIGEETFQAMANSHLLFAAALLPYAPEEARNRG